MAISNSKSSTHVQIQAGRRKPLPFLNLFCLTIFLSSLLLPFTNSTSFNFSTFDPNNQDIQYEGDATAANGTIHLTNDSTWSTGRAFYSQPIHLWDNQTGNLTDFTTHFSFMMSTALNLSTFGDGLAFFLSPANATLPPHSSGGYLGLFNIFNALNNSTNNQIVAIEFDTYTDTWDPQYDHVGIDVNSIRSAVVQTWDTGMVNHGIANAWVSYKSSTTTLSFYLTYDENPVFDEKNMFSYVVNLRDVLPEWIHAGFSAATGQSTQTNRIVSWSFNSTTSGGLALAGGLASMGMGHKRNLALVVGLAVSISALACGVPVGLFWFMKKRKKIVLGEEKDINDDDFEKGTGPRRFTFCELSDATNNFSEREKLGQGGFGGVYKGVLIDTKEEIAAKRFSKRSNQGKKEYTSEVKIFSRLSHRNLVRLIGWCHEQGEFILVYKFMTNGSLDTHLFGGESKLIWTVRYEIALGLAFALRYLHEEWEECVIHRDIKSSNIMLDSNYNARLGDFGLARLVDHKLGLKTTVLAGTIGYIAPECLGTGKASKESDIYSFGVVVLEIACGRRPVVELIRDESHVRLSEWVWRLYGEGKLFEAVDKDLKMEYDERQIERIMLVGLWCCHPDPNSRPSISQAINMLKFDAPLPDLPLEMPTHSPPICRPSRLSSVLPTDPDNDTAQRSSGSHASSYYLSPRDVEASKAPLQLNEDNELSIQP